MNEPFVLLREGALSELGYVLDRLGAQRVFLVVDPVAFQESGAEQIVRPFLANRNVTQFSELSANPTLAKVERGLEVVRDADPDVVIALGGGMTIDVAKAIARLAGQDSPPRDVITGRAELVPGGPPLIAIPTTAGTGSEATHFAVVYVDDVKYSLAADCVRPEVALIDPLLTHSLPASITAASGLDALCQAVESFWAVGATDASMDYARQALSLVLQHLHRAVHQPTPAARHAMCQAAHLAGRAINLGKTTAPHALSYGITIQHGIPHGPAVSISLALFLRYNASVTENDCNDPRGCDAVHERIAELVQVLNCENVAESAEILEQLIRSVGGPLRLSEIGVENDAQIEQLAKCVNAERLSNNPRTLDHDSLLCLLRTIQ